jgi:hypothetical protein
MKRAREASSAPAKRAAGTPAPFTAGYDGLFDGIEALRDMVLPDENLIAAELEKTRRMLERRRVGR